MNMYGACCGISKKNELFPVRNSMHVVCREYLMGITERIPQHVTSRNT